MIVQPKISAYDFELFVQAFVRRGDTRRFGAVFLDYLYPTVADDALRNEPVNDVAIELARSNYVETEEATA